jgi:hypothetical protein
MARDGHRSLVGRGGRKGFFTDKGLAYGVIKAISNKNT